MKQHIFIITALCAAMAVTTVSAKDYLTTGHLNDVNDFEDFPVGVISCSASRDNATIKNDYGKISDAFSVDQTSGNLCSAIDETEGPDGNTTKALHYYVEGTSVAADRSLLLQPRPDMSWATQTQGKYFVYKMKFKSGGDGLGYFKGNGGNFNAIATIDWSTGKFGWGYSTSSDAFALDEWVTFSFIVDKTGTQDKERARFESSLGVKEFTQTPAKNLTIKNSEPRWLIGTGWISGGSSNPYNPSLYIDDFQLYTTDYDITCDNNGAKGVPTEDKIELNVTGDVNEDSLNSIKVKTDAGEVEIKSVSYEEGTCTIALANKMADFTTYTVDLSSVEGIDGIKKSLSDISFTTTGKINLDGTVKLSKVTGNSLTDIDKLTPGIVQVELDVVNSTEIDLENAVIVAKLIKNNSVVALSYGTRSIMNCSMSKFISGFLVDSDSKIELSVQNSLNGTLYYADIFTVTASGVTQKAAEEIRDKYPVIVEPTTDDDTTTVHSIKLGTDAVCNAYDGTGLTEFTSKASKFGDAKQITVAKKGYEITNLVYTVRNTLNDTIHTAVKLGEGEAANNFVWDDLLGNTSYIPKTEIK